MLSFFRALTFYPSLSVFFCLLIVRAKRRKNFKIKWMISVFILDFFFLLPVSCFERAYPLKLLLTLNLTHMEVWIHGWVCARVWGQTKEPCRWFLFMWRLEAVNLEISIWNAIRRVCWLTSIHRGRGIFSLYCKWTLNRWSCPVCLLNCLILVRFSCFI